MEALTILLPDGLMADLHGVCTRHGLHMGDTVTELIRNFVLVKATIEKGPAALDALKAEVYGKIDEQETQDAN